MVPCELILRPFSRVGTGSCAAATKSGRNDRPPRNERLHSSSPTREAPSTKGPRRSGRATGSAAEGTRSAYDNRRPGPNTLSEDAEAFPRNYPEGQWTVRERERRVGPRNDVTAGPAGASAGARGFGNIPRSGTNSFPVESSAGGVDMSTAEGAVASVWKRALPALTLVLVAPLVAEVLPGATRFSAL